MKFQIKDASKIKLIIWDLDETFWKGTLSDNDSDIEPIQMNVELVNQLSYRGIISSICSKNDLTTVEEKLKEIGIFDKFVFNSINWEPKGMRVKQIIEDMALRPVNVLFIDDNPLNLAEVEFTTPEIMVSDPSVVLELYKMIDSLGKDDSGLTRLSQYKVLERKKSDSEEFESNIDFLKSSNIKICICKLDESTVPRIVELIQRSNQLNFTKKRIGEDEVGLLLRDDNMYTGYVRVADNYGEYGVVGFFALNKEKFELEHFLFSCRTMGMGIEQYVYAFLNYPRLMVVEPVSGTVSQDFGMPDYITLVDRLDENTNARIKNGKSDFKVLLKGPCDLEVMASYLESGNDLIEKEFNFIDHNGNQADYFNHLVNILNANKEHVNEWCKKYSFLSDEGFKTMLFDKEYDVVCLSPLMDATLSVYQDSNGNELAFGIYSKPLTDVAFHKLYIDKKIMTARSRFQEDELMMFSKEFHKIDYTPEMTANNLMRIIEMIHQKSSNTRIVIILLAELEYISNDATYNDNFANKHLIHKKINAAIKENLADRDDVYLLDVNNYVKKQSDYFDNINHYSKMVYYKMAQEFVRYMESIGDLKIGTSSKLKVLYQNIKRKIYKMLFVK